MDWYDIAKALQSNITEEKQCTLAAYHKLEDLSTAFCNVDKAGRQAAGLSRLTDQPGPTLENLNCAPLARSLLGAFLDWAKR